MKPGDIVTVINLNHLYDNDLRLKLCHVIRNFLIIRVLKPGIASRSLFGIPPFFLLYVKEAYSYADVTNYCPAPAVTGSFFINTSAVLPDRFESGSVWIQKIIVR